MHALHTHDNNKTLPALIINRPIELQVSLKTPPPT